MAIAAVVLSFLGSASALRIAGPSIPQNNDEVPYIAMPIDQVDASEIEIETIPEAKASTTREPPRLDAEQSFDEMELFNQEIIIDVANNLAFFICFSLQVYYLNT